MIRKHTKQSICNSSVLLAASLTLITNSALLIPNHDMLLSVAAVIMQSSLSAAILLEGIRDIHLEGIRDLHLEGISN